MSDPTFHPVELLLGVMNQGRKILVSGVSELNHLPLLICPNLVSSPRGKGIPGEESLFHDFSRGNYLIQQLHRGLPFHPLGWSLFAKEDPDSSSWILCQECFALGREGDCLWCHSFDPNTDETLLLLQVAKARGMRTLIFAPIDVGEFMGLCDVLVLIPDSNRECRVSPHLQMAEQITSELWNRIIGKP